MTVNFDKMIRKEGKLEGIREGVKKMVKNLLSLNTPIEVIKKASCLCDSEFEQLLAEIQ